MKSLFNDYGIEIVKKRGKYYVQFEYGEIATRIESLEISKDDAIKAQISPDEAYNVIIKYQNHMQKNKLSQRETYLKAD